MQLLASLFMAIPPLCAWFYTFYIIITYFNQYIKGQIAQKQQRFMAINFSFQIDAIKASTDFSSVAQEVHSLITSSVLE